MDLNLNPSSIQKLLTSTICKKEGPALKLSQIAELSYSKALSPALESYCEDLGKREGACALCGVFGDKEVLKYPLKGPNIDSMLTRIHGSYCKSCASVLKGLEQLTLASKSVAEEIDGIVGAVKFALRLRDSSRKDIKIKAEPEPSTQHQMNPCWNAITKEQSNQRSGIKTASRSDKPKKVTNRNYRSPKSGQLLKNPKVCYFCCKHVRDKRVFESHIRNHIEEKPLFKCKICQEVFNSRCKFLVHHITKHKSEQKRLYLQKRRQDKLGPFSCYFCRKEFAWRGLEMHIKLHLNETPSYTCVACGKNFTQKSNMKTHFLFMHGPRKEKEEEMLRRRLAKKPVTCYFCGTQKTNFSVLVQHMRFVHTKETITQKCEVCGKCYPDKHNLRIHQKQVCKPDSKFKEMIKQRGMKRKENNRINGNCYFCEKPFISQEGLESHVKRHTKEAFLKCKKCGKEFLKKYEFKRHSTLVCHTEGNEEKRIELLKKSKLKYLRGKEQGKGTCPNCGKFFKVLSAHTRKKICEIGVRGRRRKIKNILCTCYFCKKVIANMHKLPRHLISHTKEKPYPCGVYGCVRKFHRSDLLAWHMREAHGGKHRD